MPEHPFIPFNLPDIGEAEINAVAGVLRSGWLTTGERTARFEREFGEYVGARHALALSSGTAAIHLALAALGIGPGDEVITTPLTFCATVTSILHVGAMPVLADVGPDGNLDPESVASRITPRTRALLPVHLAGAPCNLDAIFELARRHGLFVVEDAAHAAGTLYRGHHVGASALGGDAAAFSFYATKNMTTGEGGMVTTNNPDLASRMRRLALHGISKDAWNRYSEQGNWSYEVLEPGFKYNLSDIQSALGIEQLRRLERFIAVRAAYARRYAEAFAPLEEIEPVPPVHGGRHAWHLYMLRLRVDRLSIDRAAFIREMHRRRIGCSVHFIPIPLHPYFARWAALPENSCPRALELFPRLVSLPLYPAMTGEQIGYVIENVREVVSQYRVPKTKSAGAA